MSGRLLSKTLDWKSLAVDDLRSLSEQAKGLRESDLWAVLSTELRGKLGTKLTTLYNSDSTVDIHRAQGAANTLRYVIMLLDEFIEYADDAIRKAARGKMENR